MLFCHIFIIGGISIGVEADPWLRLRVEVNCYSKMVQYMVTLSNRIIDRGGFTMSGALSTLEIFAESSC